MKRHTIVLVLALFLTLTIGIRTAAAQSSFPRFESVSCDIFDLSEHAPGAVEGQDLQCGYLVVPERHDQPDAGSIRLAIVIIKSTGDNPAPDPLILAQGGPGGSGLELYAGLASPDSELGQMLRPERDLIVFEQRGTRYSLPFLFCQEVLDLELNTAEQELSLEEEARLSREAFQACKVRLEAEGIDLAAYNSIENARDIIDLAHVLGYDRLNYYGVSYGTMLGQHLMRLKPELLRSAILDGIVPLDVNPNQEMPVSKNRGFSLLFESCEADPDCNAAYPDLETVFLDTVDTLNQNPARVPIADLDTHVVYDHVFDGDDLTGFVMQLLYVTDAIPILPKLIYDAHNGDFDMVGLLSSLFAFDRSDAEAMYISVMCAEDYDYQVSELNTEGVRPLIAGQDLRDHELILQICDDWGVPQLGPSADEPVVSDIPTLLFSGNFDPVTPPPNGDTLARTLSHSTNVLFPANGHGALMDSQCANRIVRDFLNDPTVKPDTGCAGDVSAPIFISPANTLTSPGAVYLLSIIETAFTNPDPTLIVGRAAALLPSFLALLGLLAFPPIWFVGWLIGRIRKLPRPRAWAARLAPWLGIVLAILAVAFVLLQLVVVIQSLSGGLQGYVGISRDFAWVYVLPLLVTLASLGMGALALFSWSKDWWTGLGRAYYTLTALLALAFTSALAIMGLLTVLFN